VEIGPADGIILRLLTGRDLPAITEMWRRCDPVSRSARFHGGMPAFPADHLAALLADPGCSVIATHRPSGAVIALASLVRNRDGESADLGVLVEDSWQRRGIARRLATILVLAAPARGIRVITAEIFTERPHLGRQLRRVPGEFSSVGNGATASVMVRLARTVPRPP
jgi:GNAT superfamily N-acetyltransferase